MRNRIPVFAAFLFFLLTQCYGIYFMLYHHAGPLGLKDSIYYISEIAYFKEFPLFNTGILESIGFPEKVPIPFTPSYSINKILHSYVFGILANLSELSPETMFYCNFYIGLFFMGIVLFMLFRKIDSSPLFIILSLVFFAFYEGKGSYHGFSWVVPSFYAILLFLLSAIALFYSKRPYLYGIPLILLLLLTHSTGIYLAAVLIVSLILNDILNKKSFPGFKKPALFLMVCLALFLFSEYLNNINIVPDSFTSSFSTYQNITADSPLDTPSSWTTRVVIAFKRVIETLQRYDFRKYYYGIYTPLVLYGVIQAIRNRKYILLSLFISAFTGQLATSLVTRQSYRFFYSLEIITWVLITYGVSMVLKELFCNKTSSEGIETPIKKKLIHIIMLWGLLALSGLFLYNAVHQKAGHNYYIKFYHPRFFEEKAFIEYLQSNKNKTFVIFTGDMRTYLSIDGMWRNLNIRLPEKLSPEKLSESPGNFVVIGENYSLYQENRTGFKAILPAGSSMLVKNLNAGPGLYRIELIDTGTGSIDDFSIEHNGLSIRRRWNLEPANIRYPEADAYPPFLLPWYWYKEKPWPLHKKAYRPHNIVRESRKYTIEFELKEPADSIYLSNHGKTAFINGVIKIINTGNGKETVIDFDRGDEKTLNSTVALIHNNQQLPLLWADPDIMPPYRNTLFKLEKNFNDIKAFSFYALTFP